MEYTLPNSKKSRHYTIENKENGEKVVNEGTLKDVKTLFAIPKEKFVIVKDLLRKVNLWCAENNHELTIDGKSFEEMYPKAK